MSLRTLALVCLAGCAQLAGLETTSGPAPADAARDPDAAAPPDARACTGGDARATDPATGACYVYFATPTARPTARTTCEALGPGALLASPQSATENQLIAGLIGTADAHLGATDEVTEGTFVWDDGTAVVLTSWNTGEPNNGAGGGDEDCMVMLGAVPGKWDDRPCVDPGDGRGVYAFVCERP